MGWLTGWGKRKKLPAVISSDGALSNYQIVRNIFTRDAQWYSGTSIALGQIVKISNNKILQCSVAGITSSVEPSGAGVDNTVTWIERPDILYIPRTSLKNVTLDDLRVTESDGTTLVPHHLPCNYVQPILSTEVSGTLMRSAWLSDGTLIGGFAEGLKLSTDRGKTWGSVVKSWTNSTKIYCIHVFASQGVEYVYAAPYSNTAPWVADADMGLWRTRAEDIKGANTEWTRVIDQGGRGTGLNGNYVAENRNATIWNMDMDSAGRIYAGEYGQDVCTLFKSTDEGSTFTAVKDWAALGYRHIHDVKCDPWNGDNVYVSVGDNFSPWFKKGIFKSTDYGATFAEILASINQVTAIVCTPDCRYFASDDGPAMVGRIWRTQDDSTFAVLSTNMAGPQTETVPTWTMWFWGSRNPHTGAVYFGSAQAVGSQNTYIICIPQMESLTILVESKPSSTSVGDGSNFNSTNWYEDEMLVGYTYGGAYTTCKKIIDQHQKTIVFKPSIIDNSDFYFYYSNTIANNAESSSNVYDFYDGFDSGSSPDTVVNWTDEAVPNNGTITKTVSNGSLFMRLQNHTAEGFLKSVKIVSKSTFALPMRLLTKTINWRATGADTSTTDFGIGVVSDKDANGWYKQEHGWRSYKSSSAYRADHVARNSTSGEAGSLGSEIHYQPILLTTKSNATLLYDLNDSRPIKSSRTKFPTGPVRVGIGFTTGAATCTDVITRVDFVAALKGTANEPTHGSWGSEETEPIGSTSHRSRGRTIYQLGGISRGRILS